MSSSELLEAYEAAVASTPEATACEPLLKALRTAAEGGSTPLSALHLKQVALGRAGACALSALLAKDSFLTYINLEGNDICDEGAVALSGPLTSHQSIFRLDLGFNTIGPKGLRALAGVVAVSPSLLCLDLSGNNLWSRLSLLAPASMSALAPLGNALAQETCRLQLLHLDQADIEPKGLTALVDGLLDNSVLVNLRLGENALDIRSAAVLAKLLRGNQTLTSLDLRDNKLGDDGAAALCEGLAENTGLRCLVLWNNGVGAAGVGAVAKAVSTSASLSILDLGGNAVGREGSEPLKTALVANKSLHTLGLANAQLGEEGGIAIAEGLEGNTRAHCVSSRCSHPAPSHSLTTLATPELARSPPIASPILWQAHAAARPEAQCARPRRADGPTPIDENESGYA
jgi:Ran GTPase-activating protein (RanGAP) involved in mRNA processing and transport